MSVTTDGRVYLVDAADDGSSVAAWSTTRLPYEPTGAMQDLREAIRRGVRKLAPSPDGVVHALYASPVLDDCDAENIAIYNVGGGNFYGCRVAWPAD